MAPKWEPGNLTRHYLKRTTKENGCFEDLLGIKPGAMSDLDYEERSLRAVAHAWAQYRGEARDIANGKYYDEAMYFVDEELVVAITDVSVSEFITCFHEHFSRKHVSPKSMGEVGERRLRFREHLRLEEQGRLIRNVRRIRGV